MTARSSKCIHVSRINFVAALVVIVGAVAGCGGSTRASSDPPAVGPATAIAYATRVNLRASDVPGLVMARFPRSREKTSGPFGTEVEKCVGVKVQSGESVGVTSRRFQQANRAETTGISLFPLQSVQSAVYVMATPALAQREVVGVASGSGPQCLKQSLLSKETTVEREGSKIGVPVLRMIKVSANRLNIGGISVYRLQTTADSATEVERVGAPNYYQELYTFVIGKSVIILSTVGSPHPFPTVTAQRLVSTLDGRARGLS
jgi:hypothetical protein